MKSLTSSDFSCAVCGHKAPGCHFGALSCRACAAFFRRAALSGKKKKCVRGTGSCVFSTKNLLSCKRCRLQKCFDSGMRVEDLGVDPRLIRAISETAESQGTIPPTLDTFLGRPNLIIFNALSRETSENRVKNYIDCQFLIEKAAEILKKGVESPIHSKTTLGKLAFGLRRVQESSPDPDFCELKKYGKEETLAHWESDFLKFSTWLAYFDGFCQLPQCIQMTITKTVWKIWNHLATLASSASQIRRLFSETELKRMRRDTVVCDWSHVDFDMSWCSRYSFQELRFFIDFPTQWKMDDLTRFMVELEPSDVELSYMLCQLCFHYVGQKYQGTVLETVEKLQESLANDLHEYYTEELKTSRYTDRLMSMMKVNNLMQQQMLESRKRKELGRVFDVIEIESSHPEMFIEM